MCLRAILLSLCLLLSSCADQLQNSIAKTDRRDVMSCVYDKLELTPPKGYEDKPVYLEVCRSLIFGDPGKIAAPK